MGGLAFASGPEPLHVIRIPAKQYPKLTEQYRKLDKFIIATSHDIPLTLYENVVSPPEVPGKPDHGDIDFLVEKPLSNATTQDTAKALGAVRSVASGGGTSFAIPYPEHTDTYFQLDVNVCRKETFDFEVVMTSYGDLWHILGACATRFHLALTNSGLYLRMPEIEATHKKDSLLHLTSDPDEMMQFLGLNVEQFKREFETRDEVFEWATSSRVFRREFFEKETISVKEQRMREKRVMYRVFVMEWLPRADHLPRPNQVLSREDIEEVIRKEALTHFHKHERYTKMLTDHQQRLLKDSVWKRIASELPLEGKELGRIMVRLKEKLYWDGERVSFGRPRGEKGMTRVDLDQQAVDEIVEWAVEYWREASQE
ncbi:hypothetical protein ACLMJK_009380 [Lecanora helva]